MKKMVTFDFDDTININIIKEYAKSLIEKNIDVWICTSRFEPGYKHDWGGREWGNSDVFELAKSIGISKDKIIFTNMIDKYKILEKYDIVWHLDNDNIEIEMFEKNSKNKGILVEHGWMEICNKLLFE